MAFSSDLVLKNDAAADVTFSLKLTQGQRSERIDQTSTAQEPRVLIIDHTRLGKPTDVNYREQHLLRVAKTVKDPVTGQLVVGYINVTVGVPLNGLVTRAMFDDLNRLLTNATNGPLYVKTLMDKIYRGES